MVSLYNLLPASARLVLGAGASASLRDVPADSLSPGDLIRVLPGDRVPVDGAVVGGRTTVDESALTGEAMPVPKREGDTVTAGTANVDGARRLVTPVPPARRHFPRRCDRGRHQNGR
jgi:cation transport ATPase